MEIDYEEIMATVVQVVEAIGVVLMVLGGLVALGQYGANAVRSNLPILG